jgi:hypothetical protein
VEYQSYNGETPHNGDFGRVNFPPEMPLKPGLREKWQGKLVSYDTMSGGWSSLEGRQDEGIWLTCPDTCVARITAAEVRVATLLERTFWNRTAYTEDVAALEKLPTGDPHPSTFPVEGAD